MSLLRNTGSHPTADWIYDQLKGEFRSLSMGTVYRNLNILIEEGAVRRIEFASTFARFDANVEPHYHFVCERCGAIRDLPLPIDDALNDRVNAATSFVARRHRIEFYGLCDSCAHQ